MSWIYPSTVVNHESGQVNWSGSFPLITSAPLVGSATSTGSMVRLGANALRLGFPVTVGAGQPAGLEFRINSQRWARIEDSVVQLWNGSALIGTNHAVRGTNNVQTYGGGSDTWGTALAGWSDQWAVIVDFEPAHAQPSANRLIVYEFALQIHYA